MANTIQIKRSAASVSPVNGDLEKGELAWVDHGTGGAAGILYVGDMTGAGAAVRKIGGPGWGLELLANSTLTGTPTAPTVAQSVNDTTLATTAFVHAAVVANAVPISQASDTDISNQAAGHVLIWDGTDSWDNKALSGDVSIDKDGVTIVGGVAANSIALGNDTTGNFVSSITGTANEIEVTNGAGSEGAAVQIGMPDNVTITGNLIVNGTTTQVDSTVVTVADPIFTLGANSADSKDRGIAMKYGAGVKFSWMGMDETDDKFKYIADATNTGEVMSGSLGNAAFGTIDGTLTTASQPAITGVGTIGTGVWEGTAVSTEYGGTGQDFSSANGVLSLSGGTMSVASEMPVTLGGTGVQAVATGAILLGANTADMTPLTIGAAGQHLTMESGLPAWSDAIDGGTF